MKARAVQHSFFPPRPQYRMPVITAASKVTWHKVGTGLLGGVTVQQYVDGRPTDVYRHMPLSALTPVESK